VLVAMLALGPAPLQAGKEFQDADQTSFDESVVTLDNELAGQTTFSITTESTTIEWQDLQQPESNSLEFHFENPSEDSIVLNYIGAQHPSHLDGTIVSNGTTAFSNPFGIFIGENAVLDVGGLVAIAGDLTREDFLADQELEIPLEGAVENLGSIRADSFVGLFGRTVVNQGHIDVGQGVLRIGAGQQLSASRWDVLTRELLGEQDFFGLLGRGGEIRNHGRLGARDAILMGGRIVNYGEIEIADGSLMMLAADAIYLSEFNDPVLIRLPNDVGTEAVSAPAEGAGEGSYAIENHGRIEAGLGHARLAASDPLGFGIRQGTGTPEAPASISASSITLEGDETGRVHLSGEIDASSDARRGVGGEIDVTGSLIVLEDASIEASGNRGGGTIQIGGEQQGSGELQRARAVVVDAQTTIRADARKKGDGGRVIVFAEDLASVDGQLSARGGARGGDGGFVETSGLRHFAVTTFPDVSAPRGRPGLWLIDPFNIEITDAAQDCPGDNIGCLNKAIENILDPDFDESAFDGILRTVAPDAEVPAPNEVSPDLIERALGSGTNIALSTQAFSTDPGTEAGNITVTDGITISTDDAISGTTATLTLLAANDVLINDAIQVVPGSDPDDRFTLNVVLRANDIGQDLVRSRDFTFDLVEGEVVIGADIRTGGGNFTATGADIRLESGASIVTDGGGVDMRSGITNPNGFPVILDRNDTDPSLGDLDPVTATPELVIEGLIDTCDGACASSEEGGAITLIAGSIGVDTNRLVELITGQLRMLGSGWLRSGGGDVTLSGAIQPENEENFYAGSVQVEGAIESRGGDVAIDALRVDPTLDPKKFDVEFVSPVGGEGGEIDLDAAIQTLGGTLSIGSDRTQSIEIDGIYDTTIADDSDNGLASLRALDSAGVDEDDDLYGQGEIVIGASTATSIDAGGLAIDTRSLTTSDAGSPNAVRLTVVGESESELESVIAERIDVRVGREAVFGENTALRGETIDLRIAPSPTALAADERADRETRLTFAGSNAGGSTIADGVRLEGDLVRVVVGDGTTPSDDLFADDLGTPADPTDFGLERTTRADWAGLQLRSATGTERPQILKLAQDASLAITDAASGGPDALNLEQAFGGAAIGNEGLTITTESADGVLSVLDAAGFNNDPGAGPGSDAGKSWVTLLGGLLLPDAPTEPPPSPESVPSENSVVFGDGTTPLGPGSGTEAFDVEALEVATPGDYRISAQIADSIATVSELVFEAGRDTGVEGTAGRGGLTIESSIALQADRSLSLRAAGLGYGNLVFETPAGPQTMLSANEIELRAGIGTSRSPVATDDLSRIEGLRDQVSLRDAGGNAFGAAGSTAEAFTYRQDAAIDAEGDAQSDLPTLDQFGVAGTGFVEDVRYAVRADEGSVDLDDDVPGSNEADQFLGALLSLVGLRSDSSDALLVSDDFDFQGREVELGGVRDFVFDQQLATAFNRTASNGRERITLRAGLDERGTLRFDNGSESVVQVVAPRIELVAGDGTEGDFGSKIDLGGVEFDLTGVPGAEQTFVFQQDADVDERDLPAKDLFAGGNAGLPDVLAVRGDGESLVLTLETGDFELSDLPLDVTDDPGRLVLEGRLVSLGRSDGVDLDLTGNPNLALRLRAEDLRLLASDRFAGEDEGDNRVLVGSTASVTQGPDAAFDAESLLIEAFDEEAEIATTGNLSELSADPDNPGEFDLAEGYGPTLFTIEQDGPIEAANLPDRDSISGQLARAFPLEEALEDEEEEEDDEEEMLEDEEPVPTRYTLASLNDTVEIAPDKVDGSILGLAGRGSAADQTAFLFTSGLYRLESLSAFTPDSIVVPKGTQIEAEEQINLAAAEVDLPDEETTEAFGKLVFEDAGGGTTRLVANRIVLTAGPAFELTDPDTKGDDDDDPDEIPDALLPRVETGGLDELVRSGDLEGSVFALRQSASLDVTRGGETDVLTPLEAGLASPDSDGSWERVDLASPQSDIALDEPGSYGALTDDLFVRTGFEGAIVVTIPASDPTTTLGFDGVFDGSVEIEANDITFTTEDGDTTTSLDLAADNLLLINDGLLNEVETEDDLFELRDEEDPDRPILRVVQGTDFGDTELPRLQQYRLNRIDFDPFTGELVEEVSETQTLAELDILLETSGGTLSFDDDLRDRVATANLILASAGDVTLDVTSPTPGFSPLELRSCLECEEGPQTMLLAADVFLGSLEIRTNDGAGQIGIEAYQPGSAAVPLTLGTEGDQLFAGDVELLGSLVTAGRDIGFDGDIMAGDVDAGLALLVSSDLGFAGNLGSAGSPLAHLTVLFDRDTEDGGVAEFGTRTDTDGDGIAEEPVESDQGVFTRDDIFFVAVDPSDIDPKSIVVTREQVIEGRSEFPRVASIGKARGDLTFDSAQGDFVMGAGERLSVGGTARIELAPGGVATLSDASVIALEVVADEIELLRRSTGTYLGGKGSAQRDGGPSITTNLLDFGGVVPTIVGRGRSPYFGFPDPFDPPLAPGNENLASALDRAAVFAINASGKELDVTDFVFSSSQEDLLTSVPFVAPTGASRSDFSGAYEPLRIPTPQRLPYEPIELKRPDRVRELDVEPAEPTPEVRLTRLRGAVVIDDLARSRDEGLVYVTSSRLDAEDAEAAIALYEEIFGRGGERTEEIRAILQEALDRYLETTRARRVVGFELRRFIKNRPITLIEAHQTLADLDLLFRYHRRLGLSPGEYRPIQRGWLRRVQPDGITLDELSETIHPSRYVRGSDILDIFGQ
jgi:filamentous hemagglutinin family protein